MPRLNTKVADHRPAMRHERTPGGRFGFGTACFVLCVLCAWAVAGCGSAGDTPQVPAGYTHFKSANFPYTIDYPSSWSSPRFYLADTVGNPARDDIHGPGQQVDVSAGALSGRTLQEQASAFVNLIQPQVIRTGNMTVAGHSAFTVDFIFKALRTPERAVFFTAANRDFVIQYYTDQVATFPAGIKTFDKILSTMTFTS